MNNSALILYQLFLYLQIALDREEQSEYNVLIAMGRRGVIRGKEILAVSCYKIIFPKYAKDIN